MAVKKYKLVIMGASGVGKTVFLGSYFYATIQRGMKEKHVVSLQQDAVKPAQSLMEKLFMGAQEGTDRRINMSFNVDSTMAVQLSDLPGGYTTDVDQWLAQGVKEDLQTADGVIFFISADDLLHDYYKCVKDVVPFTTAISQFIRMNKEGAVDARADVPIYFLFTKCDLIKNDRDENGKPYTAKKLLAKAQGLKTATKVGEKNIFFRKGQRDRAYMTCALGNWLDANTPPLESDYAPQNVIEPMEDMFDAMQGARTTHVRTKMSLKTALVTGCAVATFVALLGLDWGVQRYRWNSAEKTAELATAEKNFAVAVAAYEDYRRTPPILPILPRFMLPGSDVSERIDKLNSVFEIYSYNKLEGYLSVEDKNKIPDTNNATYKEAAAEIDAYLKNENFMLNAPDHYKKVKDIEAYYAMGAMLSNEIKTYDDIQYALSKIDVIPESWRPILKNRIIGGLNSWGQAVAQEEGMREDPVAAIEVLDKATEQAGVLLDNPLLAKEGAMCKQVEGQIKNWGKLADKRWDKLVTSRIDSAKSYDAEKAVKSLESTKNSLPGMPIASQKKLEKAIAVHYSALAQSWKNAGLSSAEVKEKLANFPDMPADVNKVAWDYIRQQDGVVLENLRTRLSTARELKDLNGVWKDATRDLLGTSVSPDELKDTLQNQFLALVKQKLSQNAIDINSVLAKHDKYVRGALQKINDYETKMNKDIADFAPFCDTDVAKKALAEWKAELLPKAENAEYMFIKAEFMKIKSPSALQNNFTDMGSFIKNYPDSPKRTEVEQASDYLEALKNGCQATVKIERVSVIKHNSTSFLFFEGDPKLYVVVSGPATAQTKPISGKEITPYETFSFTWRINSAPLEVKVYNDDPKELLGMRDVICDGIRGWKDIANTFTLKDKDGNDNGNIRLSVSVRDLPVCPWF